MSSELRKKISGLKDLAINGAPPAFDRPLHVGRPNIGEKIDLDPLINGIFDRGWLTNDGPLVRQLEATIAEFLRVRHCLVTCNGTVALEIAAKALNLSGEVILPAYTFIATASALQWIGLKPVFADIDRQTHNLDPLAVRQSISPTTSAIVGVHLWGRGAPHHSLQSLADEHGLSLIYDAAHAFGCSTNGLMIGNLGSCEILSFHATKVFNTLEGGAIVTNDDMLAERVALMRNFGFSGYDNVLSAGINGKMNEVSAAVGLTNLRSFSRNVERNRANYNTYKFQLGGIKGLHLLPFDEKEKNNFQYVVIEVGPEFPVNRDRLVEILWAEQILARKYFWPGCHRMPYYASNPAYRGRILSNTDYVANRVIVLPTGPSVSPDDIKVICSILAICDLPR